MDRSALVVIALVLAPVPLVFFIAILRGYTITVVFRRRDRDG